jgi:hypothetical protein
MKFKIHIIVILALTFITLSSSCKKSNKNKFDSPTDSDKQESDSIRYNPVEEDAYAFPGAEGGGMNATGGRGGKVYKVTSLEDENSEGTLRYAIEKDEPRIIVFDVSGTIYLRSQLRINYGDVTISGQTAPGEGICLAHFPVSVNADNVIIRYLRCRMGDTDVIGSGGSDGADAMGGRQKQNIIVDHCSISWSTDECCSFYDNENFTLQWCIISESLRLSGHSKGPHGYGGIWGGVNASFHHNLMTHHDSRTPRYGPGALHAGTDRVDVRNNVFYNWNGNGCYGGEAMHVNIINNYYKPGPATQTKVSTRIMQIDISSGGGDFEEIKGIWGKYYITGNVFPENSSVSANNWNGVNIYQKEGLPQGTEAELKLNTPVETDPVETQSASVAYEKVLSYAGCYKSRDIIDERIVNEVKTGTATYIGLNEHNGYGTDYPGSDVNWKSRGYPKPGLIDSQDDLMPEDASSDWSAWPDLNSTPSPTDTDGDGMPDVWEKAHELDPENYDANKRYLSTAYDNIEVYMNSLVETITEGQKE